MIKANELRIGNWVLIDDEYCQIKSIWEDSVMVEGNGDLLNKTYPIHLTPEILEKAVFGCGDLYVRFINHSFFLCYEYDGQERTHDGIPLKYVHQLQNLYFALTGNELDINL